MRWAEELQSSIRDTAGYWSERARVRRRFTPPRIADGVEFAAPSTIDDPVSLVEIRVDMQRRQVGVFL